MFSKVLDCPDCKHRFNFDHTGDDFPERITCPQCHNSNKFSDFSALTFCPQCRAKLKIPLDIIFDGDLSCPSCGTMLNATGTFLDETAASTLGGSNAGSAVDRRQLYKRMLQDGDIFDKYQIIRLLGKGGMAEVYLAEHLLLKQKCAVKLMRANMNGDSEMAVKRFLREAKLSHQFNHPNIVKVFDVGSDFQTGFLFIAMEYVEGKTLHDLAKEKPFTEEELAKVLVSMANALNALAEVHVVHRDIKPSNIMLTNDGVYKLMDLGIAKSDSASHMAGDMTLTMEQSTIGTPNYASPEQCRSAHNVDLRSDIYSLGATLYHLASGKLPFSGTTAVETILNVMQTEAIPLSSHRPDLSEKMLGLIEQMMRKNPDERPQLPDALLAAMYSAKSNKIASIAGKTGSLIKKIFSGNKTENTAKKRSLFYHILRWGTAAVLIFVILINLKHISNVYKNYKKAPDTAKTDTVKTIDLLKNKHPLMAYPDEFGSAAASRVFENRKHVYKFPTVTFDSIKPTYNYDFSKEKTVPDNLKKLLKNNVLDLSEVVAAIRKKTMLYFPKLADLEKESDNFTISVIFRTAQQGDTALFYLGGNGSGNINVFVYRGKVTLLINKHYIATNIEVPNKTWCALTFIGEAEKRKLTILSGNRLAGAFLLPEKKSCKNIGFNVSYLSDAQSSGDALISRLLFYDRALNIKLNEAAGKLPPIVDASQEKVDAEPDAIFKVSETAQAAEFIKKAVGASSNQEQKPSTTENAKETSETTPAKIILKDDLNKVYLNIKRSTVNVSSYRPINSRLQMCRERLEKLLAAPANDDLLYEKKIALRRKQIEELLRQQKIRRKVKDTAKRQYNAAKTAEFKRQIEDYIEKYPRFTHREYTLRDKLKDPEIDPNVMLVCPKQISSKPISLWRLVLDRSCNHYLSRVNNDMIDILKKRHATPELAMGCPLSIDILAMGSDNIESIVDKPLRYGNQLSKRHIFNMLLQKDKNNKQIGYNYSAEDFKKYIMLAPMLERSGIVDEYGRTPMHYAVMHDDPEIAELLLAADFPDGKKPDNANITPWQMALHFGSAQMVDFLRKHNLTTAETPRDSLQYKLRVSYKTKDYETVKQCLRDGADPYLPNGRQLSLLTEACSEKDYEMVKFLLDNGMDPDYQLHKFLTTEYTPAWYIALTANSPEVFELVVARLMQLTPRKSLVEALFKEIYILWNNQQFDKPEAFINTVKQHCKNMLNMQNASYADNMIRCCYDVFRNSKQKPEQMQQLPYMLEVLFDFGFIPPNNSRWWNENWQNYMLEVYKNYQAKKSNNAIQTPAADAADSKSAFRNIPHIPELESERTIANRLAWCKKRLAVLQNAENDFLFKNEMIDFVQKQIAELTKQQEITREVSSHRTSTSQINSDTRRFISTAKKYLQEKKSSNGSTWEIRQELNKQLKEGRINVNAEFQDIKSGKKITIAGFLMANGIIINNSQRDGLLQENFVDVNKIDLSSLHYPASSLIFYGREDIDSSSISPIFQCLTTTMITIYNLQAGTIYRINNARKMLMLVPRINNKKDSLGRTLMHYAALGDSPEFARELIYAGFRNIDTTDNKNLTPWRLALRCGSRKMVDFFKMHGLDSGDTPQDHLLFKLWCAVQDNDLKTVEECLKNGVGHDAENGKSLDLIQTACDMENKELLKLLIKYNINLQKKYIDDTPYGMIHPLKIAAVKYNAEMLNMLFEAGYKLESATPSMNYNINRFIMYTLRNMFSNFRIATLQISPGQLPITQLEEKLVDTLKVIVKNTPERSVARRYIVNCCFSNYMLNWNPGQKSGVKVTEYLLSIDPNYRVPEHYISRARGKIRELLEAHNRKLPDASNRKTSTPRRRSGKR